MKLEFSPERLSLLCPCGTRFVSHLVGAVYCDKCTLDRMLGKAAPSPINSAAQASREYQEVQAATAAMIAAARDYQASVKKRERRYACFGGAVLLMALTYIVAASVIQGL